MALIYFLTTDPALARREAAEAGWMQAAINRWVTPDRNDIRIVSSRREIQHIPGGTLILPARDLRDIAKRMKEEEEALASAEAAAAGVSGKEAEAAQAVVSGARMRLARVEESRKDAAYARKMVDDGMAQWIGNPLLGEDATQDMIEGFV